MSQFSRTLESSDLNHIINQRSTLLTGVLPLSLQGKEFIATNVLVEEGREVEINGFFAQINAEYVINLDSQTIAPSVGSVFTDPSGRQVKVLQTLLDDDQNPLQCTLICEHRHINA